MLEAAAGKAELTSQIRSLLAWVGPGRKLTQTGRIGLADARHLVELLGTGDTIDPEIGGPGLQDKIQRGSRSSQPDRGVGEGRAPGTGQRHQADSGQEERPALLRSAGRCPPGELSD